MLNINNSAHYYIKARRKHSNDSLIYEARKEDKCLENELKIEDNSEVKPEI
jgi:hypothetical protein